MTIPTIKAVIFDMDGVIADTNPTHLRAWTEFLKRHDIPLTKEEHDHMILGRSNKDIIHHFFGEQDPDTVIDLAKEKESLFRELYQTDETLPGLRELLDQLDESAILHGISTSAPPQNIALVLEKGDLVARFPVITNFTEVTHNKPHPEIFLKTAEKLGVEPERCIVFEDSQAGVKGAKAAGMQVIGVTTSHTKEELDVPSAIHDFTEITLDKLKEF